MCVLANSVISHVINFYMWLSGSVTLSVVLFLAFSLSWEQRERPHYYLAEAAVEESGQAE